MYVSQKGTKRKPLTPEHRAKIAGGRFLGVVLQDPEGVLVEVGENLKEWCRTRNLPYTTVTKLVHGECKTCLGWRMGVALGDPAC